MNTRKVITLAVPLLIGVGILLPLWMVTGPRESSPSTSSTASSAIPQNTAHERASLEEELRKSPDHLPILLRLAEIAASEGKAQEAISYLRQAVQADGTNADARLELGRALYDSGDIEGALRETQQLVKDHPDNVDGLYNLGAIYANQNQSDLARQYWTQAVAVNAASDSGRKAKDGLAVLNGSGLK